MAINVKITIFDRIWKAHNYKTVQDRTMNLGSIPRFWGSKDTLAKTKTFYYVRFKSYGQNEEMTVFLNFKVDFAIFELPIKIEL